MACRTKRYHDMSSPAFGQGVRAQPIRRRWFVRDVHHEPRRPGSGHAHAPVVDVRSVSQDRSDRSGRGDLRRIEVGVVDRAEIGPLHLNVRCEATRHHAGRPRLGRHVAQVDEHCELLVARLVARHHERVVAVVGVQQLLVARCGLAILGTQHGLIEPQVRDPE